MADLSLLHDPTALANADAFAFVQSTTFEELPEEAKTHIDKKFIERHFVNIRQHEFAKQGFDRETAVKTWLARFSSPHTRRRYQTGIQEFFTFLDDIVNVHIFDLNAETVDQYVAYLGKRFPMPATQINTLNVASSFCKQLVRTKVLTVNYFLGTQRPKLTQTTETYVPKEGDIQALLAMADASRSLWRGPALRFMLRTGCRVGLFASLHLEGGRWVGVSKESAWRRSYADEDASLLPHLPIKPATFCKAVERMVKDLLRDKRISHGFSVHDLRHFCAIREYEASGHDLEHVREFLGHQNVNTTQIYLKKDLGVAL